MRFLVVFLLLVLIASPTWATNNIISDQIIDGDGNPYQRLGGGNAMLGDLGLDTVPLGPNPPVRVVPWGTLPADIAQMQHHGDKLYFGTTPGQIWEYDLNGNRDPTPFLDVAAGRSGIFSTSGPFSGQGLRGFAFHPNFNNNGLFYTMHRETTSGGAATFGVSGGGDAIAHYVLGEWNFNDLVGGNPSFRSVLRVAYQATDHVSSQINFNPVAQPGNDDYGNLYIAFGDGGGECSGSGTCHNMFGYGQNMQAIQSSLIRINPLGSNSVSGQYDIPDDNPFVDDPAALDEIYAKGFRNPTTMMFDQLSGALYSGDISQNTIEEINLIEAGHNYGWGVMEGTWLHTITDNSPSTNNSDALRYVPLGDGSDVTATSATYTGLDFDGNPVVYDNINRLNDGFTSPIAQFSHERNQLDADNSSAAITGTAYRGVLAPQLEGLFLYSNLSQDEIYYVLEEDLINDESPGASYELRLLDESGNPARLWQIVGAPSGSHRVNHRFGQDASGDIYIISKHNDVIYRLEGVAQPSIMGDLNLDGVVDEQDVAAFITGWMKTAPVGVESWMLGDLNLDGITNLADVYLMHQALADLGLANLSPYSDLFPAVPEPSAWQLLLCGLVGILARRKFSWK